MTALAYQTSADSSPAMRGPALVSIIFHAVVITLGIVGLPYIHKPPPIMDDAISVEILDIAEIRQTDRAPVKAPPPPEPPKEEKPPEKKVEKPPAPPKNDVKEPPKAVPPKPPEPKKEEVKKAEPKVPPPPTEKLKEPEPKPEPEKEEVVDKQQQEDFNSLLKNLQDAEPEVETEKVNPEADTPPTPSPLAQFSQRLTMSEADALRHQLSQCWSIQAGARYAEDLVVEIKLNVNPDRTVRSATIVNMGRYNQDGFFRAAADSAMRAVRSPMCNPLNLPPEKYEIWKDIVAVFDPRDLL